MNTKPIALSVILAVLTFLQLLCISCREGEIDKNAKIAPEETDTQRVFVSHVIYAPEATEHEFISYLQNQYLPIWRKLKDENILHELSVFKLTKTDSTTADRHLLNYLILAQLCPGIKARDFLKVENLTTNPVAKDSSSFQILRTEELHCVPNAYFPALSSEGVAEITFLVEFIAVKDSAQFLKEYHDLMNVYFGPLNGALVKEGKLYNIYMMETMEVFFQMDDRLTWNQIHLSGDFPEYKDLDWDSLYTDSFVRIFSCELDSVWALLPPTLNTSFDCEGRLIERLHVK